MVGCGGHAVGHDHVHAVGAGLPCRRAAALELGAVDANGGPQTMAAADESSAVHGDQMVTKPKENRPDTVPDLRLFGGRYKI